MRRAGLVAAPGAGIAALGMVACVSLSGLSGRDGAGSDADRDGAREDARATPDAHPRGDAKADARTGVVDAVADGAPGSACPSFSFFCDGFESGDFSRWDLPLSGAGATLTVDTVKAYRGKLAAHAATAVDGHAGSFVGGSRYAQQTLTPPLESGTFAMRAYLFLAESQAEGTAYAALTATDGSALDVGIDMGALSVAKAAFVPDAVYPASSSPPIGRWFCFEWLVVIAGDMTGNLALYQDGVPVLDTAAVTLPPSGRPFTSFELGYVSELGARAEQAFFDDVVLATQRVGCEDP